MTELFSQTTFLELCGLRILGVTGASLSVWQGLRIHDSIPGGECRPSQEALSRNLGVDYRAVRRGISKLKEKGLIEPLGQSRRVITWKLNLELVRSAALAESASLAEQGKTTLMQNGATGQIYPDAACLSGQTDPHRDGVTGHPDPDAGGQQGKMTLMPKIGTGRSDPDAPPNRANLPSLSGQNDPHNQGKSTLPREQEKNLENTQIHNANGHQKPRHVSPPSGDGVDSPVGEVEESAPKPLPIRRLAPRTPAEELCVVIGCLMAQPWWLSNSNQDMRQGQTERLLRDYVRKWPARSALLWVAVATHEHAGRIRHGSPGAFVFSHLRGYGRNGWNPENKSAKERALHVAILRCDEAAAFHALSLESSYAPENRAKAFKAAEAGVGPPPASAVEDPGSSAAADRAVNEASSCLGDIPGWMLNAPGADAFERNRNRLHATHSLAGRLSIRCMVSKVADTLLGLFRSDAHELQALGITAAWVQAALEAEALGKAPVRLPELPDSFWPSVLAGDYKLASMSLSKQSPRTVEVE